MNTYSGPICNHKSRGGTLLDDLDIEFLVYKKKNNRRLSFMYTNILYYLY